MRKQVGSCAQYYKNTCDKRVLIVGLEPPPFGGVSVHISRVAAELAHHNTVQILDVIKEYSIRSRVGYFFFLLRRLFKFKPDIIYYHTLFLRANLSELVILIVYAKFFGSRLSLVEHSSRFLYKRSRFYTYKLNKLMYFIDQQVLIGQPMLISYQKNNIKLRSYVVDSSFVPPITTQEKEIFAHYPKDLQNFLNQHCFIMLMNASKFGFWDNKDIYGFDMCVRLMHDLVVGVDVGLVMAVGTIYDHKHYESVKEQLGNDKRVYLLIECQQELWPLIKRAHLFVRPSRYDNSSLSVSEAAWFGVPVVASDVTERPAGSLIFKTGDYEGFLTCVRGVYERYTGKHYCANEKSL